MGEDMRILVTGATGKVGQAFIKRVMRDSDYEAVMIRALCHNRKLDNAKAKFLLGWRPQYNLERIIDEAFDYQRAVDDPRVVWYPG